MKNFRLFGLLAVLSVAVAPCAAVESQVSFAEGNYEVVVQTVLPNLEENLRNATTKSAQCLQRQSVTRLFPVLEHPSFDGCELVSDGTSDRKLLFDLQCRNPQAASGVAVLTIESKRFKATLDIRMGGKNMGFRQIVSGNRTGACSQ